MYRFILALAVILTLARCQNNSQEESVSVNYQPIPVQYPETRKDTTVIDDYFGTKVADPYRWLEDDHAPEVKEWVKRQNEVTFAYLAKIPFRDRVRERLKELWNYAKYSTPIKVANKYYFLKNDGLQNQAVLYGQNSLDDAPQLILDPNKFSEDGTVAMSDFAFSRDGRYLAYQVSEGGSDWNTILVKDLQTGRTLPDSVRWVKFSSIAWFRDGFFYSRYPEPAKEDVLKGKNQFHQVYFHKVNTPQAEDRLIYADRSHPDYNFYCMTTEDEHYLALAVAQSTSGNALYIKDLMKEDADFVPVTESFEADLSVVDNAGDELYILTNADAPNQRLIRVSATAPQKKYWQEVIPEAKDVLKSVVLAGDKIIGHYLHNASSLVKFFDRNGHYQSALSLPGIGTVSALSGKKDDPELFYSFTSFTHPTTIYHMDLAKGKSEVFKKPEINFDPDAYVTKQFFYKSKDGTRVPVFVTHKKGMKLDGKRPTLLYGYGGFNISILPAFSLVRSLIMENDGVYAVANIRGGGEFGQKWHLAGTKANKQNVFDDFIAAAEFLIKSGYTNPDKLGIEGGSNGGLLVGACMTQRPDLFKVAIPRVGVLDMLRYQYFTIGRAWAYDYGLSENKADFAYLYKYSPLHNVRDAKYPATLIMTGDHDDRVVPAHSFKFAAALQEHQKGDNPILIRIETSAGHGAGKPTSKLIDENADMLSFFFYNTNSHVK